MMKSFLHTLTVVVLAMAGSLGLAQQPRAEQLSAATLPSNAPVVIDRNPVTQPFPGTTSPVTIGGYQVIVERDSRKSPIAFSVTLPPTVTRVTVPAEFIQARREYLFEVLAIDKSGNQTITEGSFKTGP
jgi:hypothetical protein